MALFWDTWYQANGTGPDHRCLIRLCIVWHSDCISWTLLYRGTYLLLFVVIVFVLYLYREVRKVSGLIRLQPFNYYSIGSFYVVEHQIGQATFLSRKHFVWWNWYLLWQTLFFLYLLASMDCGYSIGLPCRGCTTGSWSRDKENVPIVHPKIFIIGRKIDNLCVWACFCDTQYIISICCNSRSVKHKHVHPYTQLHTQTRMLAPTHVRAYTHANKVDWHPYICFLNIHTFAMKPYCLLFVWFFFLLYVHWFCDFFANILFLDFWGIVGESMATLPSPVRTNTK